MCVAVERERFDLQGYGCKGSGRDTLSLLQMLISFTMSPYYLDCLS